MNSTKYQNVLEVRELLEKYIAVAAIRNSTQKDIRCIEQSLVQRKKEVGSIRETTQADLNFHIAIAKATHNDIILSMYRYVSEYFNEFIYQKLHEKKQDQGDIDQLHDLLFEAIRDKDQQQALDCVCKIIAM